MSKSYSLGLALSPPKLSYDLSSPPPLTGVGSFARDAASVLALKPKAPPSGTVPAVERVLKTFSSPKGGTMEIVERGGQLILRKQAETLPATVEGLASGALRWIGKGVGLALSTVGFWLDMTEPVNETEPADSKVVRKAFHQIGLDPESWPARLGPRAREFETIAAALMSSGGSPGAVKAALQGVYEKLKVHGEPERYSIGLTVQGTKPATANLHPDTQKWVEEYQKRRRAFPSESEETSLDHVLGSAGQNALLRTSVEQALRALGQGLVAHETSAAASSAQEVRSDKPPGLTTDDKREAENLAGKFGKKLAYVEALMLQAKTALWRRGDLDGEHGNHVSYNLSARTDFALTLLKAKYTSADALNIAFGLPKDLIDSVDKISVKNISQVKHLKSSYDRFNRALKQQEGHGKEDKSMTML